MDYELSLTQQEVQIVMTALGELPLKLSINVLMKIQNAVRQQDEARAMSTQDLAEALKAQA